MKLSEAMMLGMSMYTLNPRNWICRDGGCLLGVAGRAAGLDTIGAIGKRWPWIDRYFAVPAFACQLPALPRGKGFPFLSVGSADSESESAVAIISFLANHVKEGNVTLERVVEWVASVEPQEEPADGGQEPVPVSLEVPAS